jgi:hypothetical protein
VLLSRRRAALSDGPPGGCRHFESDGGVGPVAVPREWYSDAHVLYLVGVGASHMGNFAAAAYVGATTAAFLDGSTLAFAWGAQRGGHSLAVFPSSIDPSRSSQRTDGFKMRLAPVRRARGSASTA